MMVNCLRLPSVYEKANSLSLCAISHLFFYSTDDDAKGEDVESGLKIGTFVPQFSVFFYTIFLQWSIAFAVVLIFFLDWFAVSICNCNECL